MTAAEPVLLSPECGLAHEDEKLHRLCSNARDIPLPGALPGSPLLATAWCKCECHIARGRHLLPH